MRRVLALASLSGVLFAVAASAQNYVPPQRYNGPEVMVNLDVLNGGSSSSMVTEANLPPLVPPPLPPIVEAPRHLPMRQPLALTPPVHMPPPPPPVADVPMQDHVHDMLAQARADAAGDAKGNAPTQKRAPVIFDEPMAAPNTSSGAPVETQKIVSAPEAEEDKFEAYRILFADKDSKLSDIESEVLHKVIDKMKAAPHVNAQILAFAKSTPDTVAAARRLSLMRALAVRTEMTANGIAANRLNVRAMGMDAANAAPDKAMPADRVDIIFVR